MHAPRTARTSHRVLGTSGARVLVVGTRQLASPPGGVIGTGTDSGDHTAGRVGELVTGTVSAVGRVLIERCGLPGGGLTTLSDPGSPLDLGAALADAAEQATDAIVVYYTGSVLVDGDGTTHLATTASDTRPARLPYTALPVASVLATMATSRATVRILVVDGLLTPVGAAPAGDTSQAAPPLLPDQPVPPVQPVLPGVTPRRGVPDAGSKEPAPGGVEVLLLASPDAEFVASESDADGPPLSAELVRLLVNGDPDGPPELTVGHVARRVVQCLGARSTTAVLHAPAPWSDGATIAGNAAHTPPIADLEASPTTVLSEGPGPVITPTLPPAAAPTAAGAAAPSGGAETCPYPGLASFDAQWQQWFYGRERAIAEALTRLEARLDGAGPLVLVGASGSGKSSLLRAGLLPALARGAVSGSRGWPQLVLTPTEHPPAELARRVAEAAGLPVLGATQLDVSEPDRFTAALSEILTLRPAAPGSPGSAGSSGSPGSAGRRVVVVVDQFEETFTLCTNEQERSAFIRALVAASRGTPETPPPAAVVLGVRADFYGWCAAHTELVDALQTGQVVVGPMTSREIRDAVVKPAEAVGLAVEPGLVDLMLHDLGAGADGVVTDPGSLPLLAHALLATWQEREGGTLTVAGYLRADGLQGAIARTAEDTFGALDAAGQDVAWHLLMRMVRIGEGTDDTRRRVRRESLVTESSSPAVAATVLDALVTARLVSVDADDAQFAHEALLRSWPRLRGWIEVDRAGAITRQQIAEEAQTWDDGGGDASYLYSGSRLAAVRDWAEAGERRETLGQTAREFLDASIAAEQTARQAEARRTRRLRKLVAGLVVLFLFATAAMTFAFWQREQAADERDRALSRQIGTQSAVLRESDPLLAAQLAAIAYDLAPTFESRSAVLSTFGSGYGFATRHLGGHTRPIGAVAYSGDGRLVATASDDWSVALWAADDPARHEPLGHVRGHSLAVKSVAFSPRGRVLATGSDDRTVRLWEVADPAHPRPLVTLPPASVSVYGVAFSADGRLLATGGYGHGGTEVRLWDVSALGNAAPVGAVTAHSGEVRAVAFGPGGLLGTGGDDGRAFLWDVSDPSAPRQLSPLTSNPDASVFLSGRTEIRALAIGPDGRWAVIGSDDSTATIFDIGNPRAPEVADTVDYTTDIEGVAVSSGGLVAVAGGNDVSLWDPLRGHSDAVAWYSHGSTVWGVAFSSDGRTLGSAANDGALRLWEAPGPHLLGHSAFHWEVAASPREDVLATGSYDNTARLWDISDPLHPVTTAKLDGFDGAVGTATFTPDGEVLVAGSADGTVKLWDVRDITSPRELSSPDTKAGSVYSVAVSPDGRVLAVGGSNAPVELWDITVPAAPTLLGEAAGHRYDVSDVAFSPDGHLVASVSSDRTFRLWDVSDPRRPAVHSTVTDFQSALFTVSFSPDGNRVALGGVDPTVRLWDVTDPAAPRELEPLAGHTDGVNFIDFSGDGALMATSGEDGTVRLWDVSGDGAAEPYARFEGFYNGFAAAVFRPGDRYLVGTPYQVVGFVWDLDAGAVTERMCALAGDGITQEEWDVHLRDLPYDPPCD